MTPKVKVILGIGTMILSSVVLFTLLMMSMSKSGC